MKKKLFAISVIINSIFLVFFIVNFNKINSESASITTDENVKKEELISYEKYEEFFDYIIKNIDIEEFEIVGDTLGENLTIIDKELSFGKRESLSVEGNLNMSGLKPTEEILILEDKDKKNQISISISYTNKIMDNDLIAYIANNDFEYLNKNLAERYAVTTTTFKNLIFTITNISEEKIEYEQINKINKEIINLIANFKL